MPTASGRRPVGIAALLVAGLLLATVAGAAQKCFIQVEKTALREKASFLSPSLGSLRYGDAVAKLGEAKDGSWVQVEAKDRRQGWIPVSAVTLSQLSLEPGDKSVAVGTGRSEPTLAGKGFTDAVERDFRKRYPDLPFKVLDRMEAEEVDDQALAQFAREGDLRR